MASGKVDEGALDDMEAIINSMTREERQRPDILNGSRRARIARGAGVSVTEVNQLVKKFNETKKMVKRMMPAMESLQGGHGKKGRKGKKRRGMPGLPAGMSMSDLKSIASMLDQ